MKESYFNQIKGGKNMGYIYIILSFAPDIIKG